MSETEERLLAAIAAEPDAIEPRLVYADLLQSRGDPRGELAILQHHGVPSEREHELRAAISHHVAEGALGAWHIGFVDRLRFDKTVVARATSDRTWLDHPILRAIREVHVATAQARVWEVLDAWRHRASVRTVEHGSLEKALTPDIIDAIIRLFPKTRDLRLVSKAMPQLDRAAVLPLRAVRLETEQLGDGDIAPLAALSVERIALRAMVGDVGVLEPLLDGTIGATAKHLEIGGPPALPVLQRLHASGRLATLDSLSLGFSSIHPRDWDALRPYRDALAHVRLEFPRNESFRDHGARARLATILHDVFGRTAEAIAMFQIDLRWFSPSELADYARISR